MAFNQLTYTSSGAAAPSQHSVICKHQESTSTEGQRKKIGDGAYMCRPDTGCSVFILIPCPRRAVLYLSRDISLGESRRPLKVQCIHLSCNNVSCRHFTFWTDVYRYRNFDAADAHLFLLNG